MESYYQFNTIARKEGIAGPLQSYAARRYLDRVPQIVLMRA